MKFLYCLSPALAILTLACSSTEESAQVTVVDDIVQAAPENVELLLKKDHVTVMRFTLPPQTRLPPHRSQERAVYSLSDYKLEFTDSMGQRQINNFRPGDILWLKAGKHTVRNVGPITAKYLVVERTAVNPMPGVTSNIAELTPEKAKVILENANAKVIEVTLEPGDQQPTHTAAARVVYSLTPAKLAVTAGGKTTETEFAEGDVHWYPGGEHQMKNLSANPVRFLVFELM